MKQYKVIVHYTPEFDAYAYARGPCIVTGRMYRTSEFSYDDYEKWKDGVLIQNALPYLNDGDREFLISGLSPEGFKQLCGDE